MTDRDAARSRRCEECGKPTRGPEESFCDECWSVPEADKPDAAASKEAVDPRDLIAVMFPVRSKYIGIRLKLREIVDSVWKERG